MPQEANAAKANHGSLVALVARGLTLGRLALVGPFVWLLTVVARDPGGPAAKILVVCYLGAIASDWLDGRLARAAGAADSRWGVVDVVADVTFNLGSLACAAALGLIGVWVPLGVAVLGGRYL